MLNLLFIALGGAIGTLLRYGVSSCVQNWTKSPFPWGTMAVNIIGCFVIGICGALLAGSHLRAEYRPFILIGVLGSFTTFSTFGFETFELINNGYFAKAGLNILLSNVVGLAAVFIGYRLTEQAVGG